MKKTVFILSAGALIGGCAINQNVEPAHIPSAAELCVIEDDKVREGFLPELLGVLDEKGISYVVTDSSYAQKSCEWTLTYTARWSWDMTIYMSYASIKVFRNGVLDGEAIYDSTSGAFNMSKFIDSEPKIRELVEELIQSDRIKSRKENSDYTPESSEQGSGNVANVSGARLRAVNEEQRENCEFIRSITKGIGGSGDSSQHAEKAMDSALAQAAKEGADSYFVVNVDATSSGASVVLEALKCD